MSNVLTALNQRVWYVEGGVHPLRAPVMLALGKFSDDPAQTIGEAKRVSAPDPNNFNRDIQVGTIPGETSRATLAIGVRTTAQASLLQSWMHRDCPVDIFALQGQCGNPQDFTEGGEKWTYFPDGKITDHSFENFGAFGRDENNPTNEKVSMTSEEYYEFLYERQEKIGSSVTIREIYTVDTYGGDNCEACVDPCKHVLATMAGASATPGTQPVLLYSADGGENFSQQTISTLFSNEDIADAIVIGDNFILISPVANDLHWTSANEVFDGTNTWNEVTSGFVAAKAPRAISASDVRHVWIVGDGGYVYFSQNFKVGVEVQDAGVATTQNLNAVSAYDSENVLAVGNSNAVIFTQNGGFTWESVTGPSVGVNLGACWMWDADTWFAGEGAGGTGKLWVTDNQGLTWSQIGLPATYLRIDKINFVSKAEGYLTARTGGGGYVLRTITAGNEWTVLPQGKKGTPIANSYLRDIAVCSKYANTAYAAGLNVAAGIIVKMQGG